jgi:hypothetical protein
MSAPSDPRNLRAKWQRALEERRKAGATAPPIDVTPRPAGRTGRASPLAGGNTADDPPKGVAPKLGAERSDARTGAPKIGTAKIGSSRLDGASVDDQATAGADKTGVDKSGADKTSAASTDASAPGSSASDERSETGAPSTDAPSRDAPSPTSAPLSGSAGKDKEQDEQARKKASGSASPWSSVVAALVLVGGVGFALRTFIQPTDTNSPPTGAQEEATTGSAPQENEPPIATARPKVLARCSEVSKEPFVIGDAPPPRPTTTASDGEDAPEDDFAPFAVELGRGVRFAGGFAVGTQRDAEGGTVAMVATIGADGNDGKLVRLARSRGDLDPPVVASAGGAILAAMTEPNASGRAIRIAKVEGERVTWGPELSEGRDESLAIDLAADGAHGVVVWDDVPVGHERSVIELSTFDVASMRGSGARAVTPPTIDADVPRLAPRPGGFWLSYLVHGDAPSQPTAAKKDDEPEDGGAHKKGGKKGADDNPDDSDTEAAGEAIAHQWVELIPLDANGIATGTPRAVTPKDGRVIGYDLEDGADGRAVVIYREDDTPNGSNGGRVKVVTAELGGIGEPRVIAEEGVGAGVPQLHGSWVVIHSMSGPVQLGAIGPQGDVAAEIAPEAALGHGEILGADGERFLVATPAGRAMKLGVVRCSR